MDFTLFFSLGMRGKTGNFFKEKEDQLKLVFHVIVKQDCNWSISRRCSYS